MLVVAPILWNNRRSMGTRTLATVLMLLVLFVPDFGFGQTQNSDEVAAAPRGDGYSFFMLGRFLSRSGDIEGAIQAYRDAADRDVASAEMLAELAELYRTSLTAPRRLASRRRTAEPSPASQPESR